MESVRIILVQREKERNKKGFAWYLVDTVKYVIQIVTHVWKKHMYSK